MHQIVLSFSIVSTGFPGTNNATRSTVINFSHSDLSMTNGFITNHAKAKLQTNQSHISANSFSTKPTHGILKVILEQNGRSLGSNTLNAGDRNSSGNAKPLLYALADICADRPRVPEHNGSTNGRNSCHDETVGGKLSPILNGHKSGLETCVQRESRTRSPSANGVIALPDLCADYPREPEHEVSINGKNSDNDEKVGEKTHVLLNGHKNGLKTCVQRDKRSQPPSANGVISNGSSCNSSPSKHISERKIKEKKSTRNKVNGNNHEPQLWLLRKSNDDAASFKMSLIQTSPVNHKTVEKQTEKVNDVQTGLAECRKLPPVPVRSFQNLASLPIEALPPRKRHKIAASYLRNNNNTSTESELLPKLPNNVPQTSNGDPSHPKANSVRRTVWSPVELIQDVPTTSFRVDSVQNGISGDKLDKVSLSESLEKSRDELKSPTQELSSLENDSSDSDKTLVYPLAEECTELSNSLRINDDEEPNVSKTYQSSENKASRINSVSKLINIPSTTAPKERDSHEVTREQVSMMLPMSTETISPTQSPALSSVYTMAKSVTTMPDVISTNFNPNLRHLYRTNEFFPRLAAPMTRLPASIYTRSFGREHGHFEEVSASPVTQRHFQPNQFVSEVNQSSVPPIINHSGIPFSAGRIDPQIVRSNLSDQRTIHQSLLPPMSLVNFMPLQIARPRYVLANDRTTMPILPLLEQPPPILAQPFASARFPTDLRNGSFSLPSLTEKANVSKVGPTLPPFGNGVTPLQSQHPRPSFTDRSEVLERNHDQSTATSLNNFMTIMPDARTNGTSGGSPVVVTPEVPMPVLPMVPPALKENTPSLPPLTSGSNVALLLQAVRGNDQSVEDIAPLKRAPGRGRMTNHVSRGLPVGDSSFLCEICNKVFPLQRLLNRHMKCHSTIKRYSCVFCQKGFNDTFDLKRHVRTHTGKYILSHWHIG